MLQLDQFDSRTSAVVRKWRLVSAARGLSSWNESQRMPGKSSCQLRQVKFVSASMAVESFQSMSLGQGPGCAAMCVCQHGSDVPTQPIRPSTGGTVGGPSGPHKDCRRPTNRFLRSNTRIARLPETAVSRLDTAKSSDRLCLFDPAGNRLMNGILR